MTWTFGFTPKAQKQFNKLDSQVQSRIKKAVYEKLIVNPHSHLIPLNGELAAYYKLRVGNYRLICTKDDGKLYVLVVKVKHRKEVYKK